MLKVLRLGFGVYDGKHVWFLDFSPLSKFNVHILVFIFSPWPPSPTPQDVAAECEVKCMPTFQFYKKGQKVRLSDLKNTN